MITRRQLAAAGLVGLVALALVAGLVCDSFPLVAELPAIACWMLALALALRWHVCAGRPARAEASTLPSNPHRGPPTPAHF